MPAPEHGRSTYGEPDKGLTPADIILKIMQLTLLIKLRELRKLLKEYLKLSK